MNDLELLKVIKRLENLSDDGLTVFIEYSDNTILKRFAIKIQGNRMRDKVNKIKFKKPEKDNYQSAFDAIKIDL